MRQFFLGLSLLSSIGIAEAICMPSIVLAADAPVEKNMPAGIYALDSKHSSIIFRVSHLGFSHFTGRFDKIAGTLDYKPDAPEKSSLDATINVNSIDTNDGELDETLHSENWFDTLKFPRAEFHARHIDITGPNTGKIMGDFTLHGVTHDLALDVTFVGAGTMPVLGGQVMGFTATGIVYRSAYGIDNLEPLVGDEVTLQIDAEFDKEP
jgi:polyisoprenoid-binding protein YceI